MRGFKMSLSETKHYLSKAVGFLEPNLHLANSHMVHYFTHNYFERILDEKMRICLESIKNPRDVPEILLEQKQGGKDALNDFLTSVRKNSFLTSSDVFGLSRPKTNLSGNLDMSDKKSHEVVEFCNFLIDRWHNKPLTTVFDIGSGKGHLGQTLSIISGWKVVGLDVMEVKEDVAAKRSKRLKGMLKQSCGEQKSVGTFAQYSCFITENTDLKEYSWKSSIVEQPEEEFGIIGLHTCGNLASVSLNLFVKDPLSKHLCSVGCCFHLLEERFSENPFKTGPIVPQDRERDVKADSDYGFPMSQFLKSKKYSLGRNARMMASQSVHRLASEECPETMFYRAVLEVILTERAGLKTSEENPQSHFTVGRVKGAATFLDYVKKATRKLDNISVSDEECESYLAKYESEKENLLKFYYLRNCLAPVVETVILLDRLLFLQESGIDNACLVQLFDPLTSPRCFAIVAEK